MSPGLTVTATRLTSARSVLASSTVSFIPQAPARARPWSGVYSDHAHVLALVRRYRAGDAGNVPDLRDPGPRGPLDRRRSLCLFPGLSAPGPLSLETLRAPGRAKAPPRGARESSGV